MLVLTRRVGEKIMIGEIEVLVLEVLGNRVRIGVEAPRSVPVYRHEIWVKQQEEKKLEQPE